MTGKTSAVKFHLPIAHAGNLRSRSKHESWSCSDCCSVTTTSATLQRVEWFPVPSGPTRLCFCHYALKQSEDFDKTRDIPARSSAVGFGRSITVSRHCLVLSGVTWL